MVWSHVDAGVRAPLSTPAGARNALTADRRERWDAVARARFPISPAHQDVATSQIVAGAIDDLRRRDAVIEDFLHA